mmetsp:Transcript_28830/g.82590  ORF Transcript_28830/g.82590 Transcript_28830/m.82590 type:complete len:201 (-) Transcript_28830:5-607(-)
MGIAGVAGACDGKGEGGLISSGKRSELDRAPAPPASSASSPPRSGAAASPFPRSDAPARSLPGALQTPLAGVTQTLLTGALQRSGALMSCHGFIQLSHEGMSIVKSSEAPRLQTAPLDATSSVEVQEAAEANAPPWRPELPSRGAEEHAEPPEGAREAESGSRRSRPCSSRSRCSASGTASQGTSSAGARGPKLAPAAAR